MTPERDDNPYRSPQADNNASHDDRLRYCVLVVVAVFAFYGFWVLEITLALGFVIGIAKLAGLPSDPHGLAVLYLIVAPMAAVPPGLALGSSLDRQYRQEKSR